jgi:serine protease Do
MNVSTNQLVAIAKKLAAPAAVAGAFLLGAAIFAGHGSVHAASPMDDNSVSALTALDQAMEAVTSKVTPAVVNVAVTAKTSGDGSITVNGEPMQNLPRGLQQFFGPMFQGQPQQPQIEHGVGSGIIISPDGYIVTNDHVVDGATNIKVTLNDRRTLNAKVIGVDKLTDLAVIKVDAKDLPTVVWGDSTKLMPGQTVLAFGSPFGYFQFSVTRGIVSAVNRSNPYSDDPRKPGNFIQTDAAINPGNSGGPLVNAHGELVGINTFIISNGGSFAGAGFAIPSQLVRATADQLIAHGKVEHGYLGISINDVTPDNAHFFKLPDATGAIVAQVTPDSPASEGGLKTGDVVSAVNGQQILNASGLQMTVSEMAPGTKIKVQVMRDGKPETLNLTVGSFHGKTEVAGNEEHDGPSSGKLGLAVADLTPTVRQQANIPERVHGVVVENVRPGSPADDAGIQPGDVIAEVNRQPAVSASQFVDEVHKNPSGQDLLVLVWSKGNASYRTIHQDGGNQNGF